MLASITPLGERSRKSRWGTTFAWFVAGAMVGGAAIGAALGGFGLLMNDELGASIDVRTAVIAVALAIGAAWDLNAIPLPLPTTRRQVNAYWIGYYRGWVVGAGFGFQLGLGVGTIVSSALVYSVLLASLIAGSIGTGLAIGIAFGLARGLALLPAVIVTTPDRLLQLSRWLAANEERARSVASALALMSACALLAQSL